MVDSKAEKSSSKDKAKKTEAAGMELASKVVMKTLITSLVKKAAPALVDAGPRLSRSQSKAKEEKKAAPVKAQKTI